MSNTSQNHQPSLPASAPPSVPAAPTSSTALKPASKSVLKPALKPVAKKAATAPAPSPPNTVVDAGKAAPKPLTRKTAGSAKTVKTVKAVKVAPPAAKPAQAVKKAVPPAPAAPKSEKSKKPKLIRDSFTIPKAEYVVLDELKLRANKLMRPAKKSELLRAGIKALSAMTDSALLAALKQVPAIKTGRPASKV